MFIRMWTAVVGHETFTVVIFSFYASVPSPSFRPDALLETHVTHDKSDGNSAGRGAQADLGIDGIDPGDCNPRRSVWVGTTRVMLRKAHRCDSCSLLHVSISDALITFVFTDRMGAQHALNLQRAVYGVRRLTKLRWLALGSAGPP